MSKINPQIFYEFALGYAAATGDRLFSKASMAKIFAVHPSEIVRITNHLNLPTRKRAKRNLNLPARSNPPVRRIIPDPVHNASILSSKRLETIWIVRALESSMSRSVSMADIANYAGVTSKSIRSRLKGIKTIEDQGSMDAIHRLPKVHAQLVEELERAPMQVEVAERLGVTRQRVSQLYIKLGWDGRKGQQARSEQLHLARDQKRKKAVAKRDELANRRRSVIDLAKKNPRLTQKEIGILLGLTQNQVSDILCEAGMGRRYLFSPDEDELILDRSKTAREIGKLLNRSYECIANRRIALKKGRGTSKWVPSMAESEEILETYARLGTYAATARKLGLTRDQIRSVVKSNSN